ncbi:uncharacterized protein LOC143198769 [Rhynchophorus ferrugineus]
MFKGVLHFLKFLSILINKLKYEAQGGITDNEIFDTLNIKELKDIIDQAHYNVRDVLTILRSHLLDKGDPSTLILDVFNICLLYLMNMIYDESKSANTLLTHFMEFKEIINTFSDSPILLESKLFKNSVTFFASDILQVLTRCNFSVDQPQQIKIKCVISDILIEIAIFGNYRDAVLKLLLKRFKYFSTYFSMNAHFDGLTAAHISNLEFLAYTTKYIIQNSPFQGTNYNASVDFQIKQVVDELLKFVQDKISIILKNILESIL